MMHYEALFFYFYGMIMRHYETIFFIFFLFNLSSIFQKETQSPFAIAFPMSYEL